MPDQISHDAAGATFFAIDCAFLVIGIAGQLTFLVLGLVFLCIGLARLAKVINIPAATSMLSVFPIFCLVCGIAKAIACRRYP